MNERREAERREKGTGLDWTGQDERVGGKRRDKRRKLIVGLSSDLGFTIITDSSCGSRIHIPSCVLSGKEVLEVVFLSECNLKTLYI